MQIQKARIRRFGATTSWFDLAPHLTLVNFPDRPLARLFLETLETINPTHNISIADPFHLEPREETVNGHTRRIQPDKRTVAMAIFNSTTELVVELAKLSPLLFETDRIEVGRRLDYSRWLNFIELASSSRWSEASTDLEALAAMSPFPLNDTLRSLLEKTQQTERITGSLADCLLAALQAHPRSDGTTEIITRLRETGLRSHYFKQARKIVKRRLPHSLRLGGPQDRKKLLCSIHCTYLERHQTADAQPFLASLNKALSEQSSTDQIYVTASPENVQLHGQKAVLTSFPSMDKKRPVPPEEILLEARLGSAFADTLGRFRPIFLLDGFSMTATDINRLMERDITGCQWLCAIDENQPAGIQKSHAYNSWELFL